jgi:hypothetical protein
MASEYNIAFVVRNINNLTDIVSIQTIQWMTKIRRNQDLDRLGHLCQTLKYSFHMTLPLQILHGQQYLRNQHGR